jgi:hypothetical protein
MFRMDLESVGSKPSVQESIGIFQLIDQLETAVDKLLERQVYFACTVQVGVIIIDFLYNTVPNAKPPLSSATRVLYKYRSCTSWAGLTALGSDTTPPLIHTAGGAPPDRPPGSRYLTATGACLPPSPFSHKISLAP